MKKIWMLTKAIICNEEMENPADDTKGKLYRIFGILAILLIIVPSCLIVGFISYLMTLALIESGSNQEGLLFILHFLSVTAVIFGFQVVLSTFYFSSDIERLLPLPLKISEIIWVKFFKTYLAESAMEILIIFSAMIGYFIAAPVSVIGILSAVIGTVTLPLMPLMLCGIISVLLLYFTNRIRSRKQVSILVWAMAAVITVFAFWAIGGLSGLEVENFVASMQSNDNVFMRSMRILFFQNVLLTKAMATKNILFLCGYILLHVAALVIFLALAKRLYLPGLQRINSVGNKKEAVTARILKKRCKKYAADVSYLRKEVRILFRTGSYVANCVMMTYVWPVVIGVFLLWKGNTEVLTKYRMFYQSGLGGVDIIVLLLVIAVAVLTPGANAIASTAFTREGKHIDFMKYIPMSYERQIKVKAQVSILISYSSVLLSVLCIACYLHMSILKTVYMFVISFWSVVLVTALGIWLDSMHPRLVWEDETSAMRGNLNVFFNMAFSMIVGAFLCLAGYLLYVPTEMGRFQMHVLLLLFIVMSGYSGYSFALHMAAKEQKEG